MPVTFEVQGERFVVLKKEYLDELMVFVESVTRGEELLRSGRTRSFNDFLNTAQRKKWK